MTTDRTRRTEASLMMLLGHLAWLAWFWLGLVVLWAIAVAGVSHFDVVDSSIWRDTVAGWHRWLIFAAGVTTVPTYLKLYVGHGGTRRMLSAAGVVSGLALSVIAALFLAAGFSIENIVYGVADWPGAMGAGALAERFASDLVIFLAFYAAGWVVGAVWMRPQAALGWGVIGPMLLAAALVGRTDSGDGMRHGLERLWDPSAALSWALAVAIVVGSAAVAVRITREVELK